jgi:hypothetical protein
MMMKLDYFGETKKKLLCFAGEETTLEPKKLRSSSFQKLFQSWIVVFAS